MKDGGARRSRPWRGPSRAPAGEPVRVDPDRLLEFVAGPGLSVILVSVHPRHVFSPALQARLRAGDAAVALGTVDLGALLRGGGAAVPVLHDGLRACGGPAALGIAPGYWLFRDGEVLAWASGLPAAEDAPQLARRVLLGAAWSAALRRLVPFWTALQVATEEVAAERVASQFAAAAAPRTRQGERGAARTAEDELARAYALLGVATSASDAEVARAWRRRLLEVHPDLAAGDPPEFARRTQVAAELNRARDLIRTARRRARAGASG